MGYRAVRMEERAHKSGLLKLWREALHDPAIAHVVEARWSWYYDETPSGRPATWVGLTDDDEVVGCGSVYPRITYVRGKPVRAGVLSDFAVAKAHRIAGCAIAVQRAVVTQSREA